MITTSTYVSISHNVLGFGVNWCLVQPATYLFILGICVVFSTVQVISRRGGLWPEKTGAYSWSRFCTVNCRLSVSNYQLSRIRSGFERPTLEVGGECVTTALPSSLQHATI